MPDIADLPPDDRIFKELADFAPVLIWRAGTDSACDWFNKPWLDFVGRSMEEEVGNGWTENVHPEDVDRCVKTYLAAFEAREAFTMTYRLRRYDGEYRELLDNGAAYYRDGAFAGYFGSCIDVTDFNAMEVQLRQSQKMDAIGQLTGGVAHDFNNLLTVISGSVELLRRPNLSDDRRKRYIDAIGDTAERAAKLTAQLLAFSRRQSLNPETFDVVQSIDEVGGIIRSLAGERIRLEVVSSERCLSINTDRSQFDTALINMAINARDAMHGEGLITMASGAASQIPQRRGHGAVRGDFVTIAITDNGSGITDDNLKRVFEPFFTTKGIGQGTGLGLSQVIGFAKQSGGDVLVESELDQGSTFTLYLPRVEEAPAPPTPSGATQRSIDGEGICVLVVEDNLSVGEFAASALNELGYDSILVDNAKRALEELAKDCDRFHVIFSDVVMPGMSGIELGEIIKRDHPRIPILLTSGYSDVIADTGLQGFDLLRKPYSIEELSRALRKATARQSAS